MRDLVSDDHGAGVEGLGIAPTDSVEAAVAEIRLGRMVLVLDDEDRENEGDLVMAAQHATPEALAFMIRHTSGIVCVAIDEEKADQLALPRMVTANDDPRGTAFTVTVDLKEGTTTGVSAADRTRTILALADDLTIPRHLSRPGHVFPLIARPGGVLTRTGHTEAAVDLCTLAGTAPVGVLAEVMNDDGTMARRDDLAVFARRHGLVTVTIADLVTHRTAASAAERGTGDPATLRRLAAARIPTAHGEFTAITYTGDAGSPEHVALVLGDVAQTEHDEPVMVRVHSECLTGDVFGSNRCDCGEQLDQAMARIGAAGRGAVVYLRGHEGRGIGLTSKLRAYVLQDAGLDTVEANTIQGLPADGRNYAAAGAILTDLGVHTVDLLTNNPAKVDSLSDNGIRVAGRLRVSTAPNPHNIHYLATKARRMNHDIAGGYATVAQEEVS